MEVSASDDSHAPAPAPADPSFCSEIPKPLIKWVGGKTKLLKTIEPTIPPTMVNYHEPFIGGGSMLLFMAYLRYTKRISITGKMYASDSNLGLIELYRHVQKHPRELYNKIQEIYHRYNSIELLKIESSASTSDNPQRKRARRRPQIDETTADDSKENLYYYYRAKFNSAEIDSLEHAALFIFLNKTGWRGVYRESSRGFNVPFGNYNTPTISKSHLLYVSKCLQEVEFHHSDFRQSLSRVQPGDYVYLDPPYMPVTTTSFVDYIKKGFSKEDHDALFRTLQQLRNATNNVHFTMSNANSTEVTKHFENEMFHILNARVTRSIHSKNPGAKAQEVIVFTYLD